MATDFPQARHFLLNVPMLGSHLSKRNHARFTAGLGGVVLAAAFLGANAPFWSHAPQEVVMPSFASPDPADILIDDAKKALAQNETSQALDLIEQSLDRQPFAYQAHFVKGQVLERQKQAAPALMSYQKTLDLYPEFYEAQMGVARIYQSAGQPQRALEAYKTALSLRPKESEPWSRMGDVLSTQGAIPAAEQAYARALAINPRSAPTYVGLGVIRFMKNDPAGAEKMLLQALALDNTLVEAHGSLGSLYARRGDHTHARRHFEEALRLNPRNVTVARDYLFYLKDVRDYDTLEKVQTRLSIFIDDKKP